jgi:hypothetical protein
MEEGPVLVTVLPASTAKPDVVPKFTGVCAAEAALMPKTPIRITAVPATASIEAAN